MPAFPSYIPPRDADLATWADNFSDLITASPGTYGLLAGDATVIAVVVAAYLAAYAAAVNPSTRTPVTVAAKDTARTNMIDLVRPYAVQISLNAGVLSSDKIAVGVNPRTSTPTPIATPTTAPVLGIASATNLVHVIRARDEMSSPTSKAKPYGSTQMQLWAAAVAAATPTPTPDETTLKQIVTKIPVLAEWDSDDAGKTAVYYARWQTRTGLIGPWSSPVSMTIAAGG